MIVVALDNSMPVSRENLSWGAWVGDGRNRWYDKHQRMCLGCGLARYVLFMLAYATVIVWDNGRSGFLGEHSCMDGTPTLRMNEFMLGSLDAKKIDLGHSLPNMSLRSPKEVVLVANNAVLEDIQEAEKNFDKLVGAHELRVLHYDAYGKDFIKQFKMSPDAWAQLVKQLAFYMFKGRPGVTYESAQTRKFQRGRTEVIRAASSQSKAWVEAMVDSRATVRLFHVARCYISDRLGSWVRLGRTTRLALPYCSSTPCAVCSMGCRWPRCRPTSVWIKEDDQGRRIYTGDIPRSGIPANESLGAIDITAVIQISRWMGIRRRLVHDSSRDWYSINPCLPLPPVVVPDGYGLSYSIGDDHIRWTITSLKLNTDKFKHCLAEAATVTRQMMERARLAEDNKPKL
jgi:carnitine O-acetyltransferase